MAITKTQLDYTSRSADLFSTAIKKQKLKEADKRRQERIKFSERIEKQQHAS